MRNQTRSFLILSVLAAASYPSSAAIALPTATEERTVHSLSGPETLVEQPLAGLGQHAPLVYTLEAGLSPQSARAESLDSIASELDRTSVPMPAELRNPTTLSQGPTVAELSDLDTSHWAFRALQSLIDNYDCIAGYPDGTYRGEDSMSRDEFAAGLNSCILQFLDALPQTEALPEAE